MSFLSFLSRSSSKGTRRNYIKDSSVTPETEKRLLLHMSRSFGTSFVLGPRHLLEFANGLDVMKTALTQAVFCPYAAEGTN